MSNPMRHYYWGLSYRSAGYDKYQARYEKRFRHATRPGYGMGMGKNTLIHKGKKP